MSLRQERQLDERGSRNAYAINRSELILRIDSITRVGFEKKKHSRKAGFAIGVDSTARLAAWYPAAATLQAPIARLEHLHPVRYLEASLMRLLHVGPWRQARLLLIVNTRTIIHTE
jgi:hypothetical protein